MEPAIKISNISKSFLLPHENIRSFKEKFSRPFVRTNLEKLNVLKDISFDLYPGEWLGIIGRNGCGKSTLLKIISGVYQPDQGEIRVQGKLVTLLELGIGFNPELTARENICLNGLILGLRRSRVESRMSAIAWYAGVEKFLDAQLKNFSTGMQVRLAFAIAMQMSGEVYLLDEILSVGDYDFQERSAREFKHLKDRGVTVLFASHSLDSVMAYCDKTLWLENGSVKLFGDSKQVVEAYQLSGKQPTNK